MDPQQTLLLHTAWECLQNTGYSSLDAIRGSDIGVFVGATSSDARVLGQSREPLPPGTSFVSAMVANRISHAFDLKGPSVAIDTACAASLSALHAACSSLNRGECSAALVGGVNAILDANGTLLLANMGMLSPDGTCRVFDAKANGYVRGEGGGVVLLKRLSDAEQDDSRILAVIKSVVSNHNGTSATPMSPNCLAQQRLLTESLKRANLVAEDVCYIEAHGTGMKLGDPIELDAIQKAFFPAEKSSERNAPLVLGSVKANIGHLETGAGIAGLIKTVLVLEHAKAPGNACLQDLNPAFSFDTSHISIPRDAVNLEGYREWECDRDGTLLCAGVNSFGFGGSNANAILQQYSRLPHLAKTTCSLLFTYHGTSRYKQLEEAMDLFNSTFEVFNHAHSSCMDALERATKQIGAAKLTLDRDSFLHVPEVLTFFIHYGVAKLLQSQGAKISLVGGTSLCGEMVALVLSGVIVVSDAMRLLLMGLAPSKFSVQPVTGNTLLQQPEIPVFSHILGRVCRPTELPDDYMRQLISSIQEGKLQVSNEDRVAERVSSIDVDFKPLLCLSDTLGDDTETSTTVLHLFHSSLFTNTPGNSNTDTVPLLNTSLLMEHLREKFLQLRQTSDNLALKSCTDKPSKDVMVPKFYEHYPLRALVDGVTAPTSTYERNRLDSDASSKVTLSQPCSGAHSRVSIDSGYIAHTPSGESLTPQTSATNSPQKAAASLSDIRASLVEIAFRELGEDIPIGIDAIEQMARKIMEEEPKRQLTPKALYPVLTKENYYTVPSIKGLCSEQLSRVENFTVGRKGCGKIIYPGKTDITGLDLDDLVHIEPLYVEVRKASNQPSSVNLNRAALVLFEGVSIKGQAFSRVKGQYVGYNRLTRKFLMTVHRFY